jgi:hypothetical protein
MYGKMFEVAVFFPDSNESTHRQRAFPMLKGQLQLASESRSIWSRCCARVSAPTR